MKLRSLICILTALGMLSATASERIIRDQFDSEVLNQNKAFTIVLPENIPVEPIPLLVILHGLGRNEHTLIDSPETKEILQNAPFACLMPDGDGSWYINSPATPANRYADYLDEVIAHASEKYNLSTDAAHRGICGWSMGGYGAMMTMLRRPDDFSAIATIIGLLDYPNADLPKGQNFKIPATTFGTDSKGWKPLNPFFQASELSGHSVLLIAGERAFDWTMNHHFHDELARLGIDHEWRVLQQGHTFKAVQQGLPLVIDFMKKNILDQSSELDAIMADELVPETVWNISFYLDALNRRGPKKLDVSAEQAEVLQLYSDWNRAGQSADATWSARAQAVSDQLFEKLIAAQDLIFSNARNSGSQAFPYRCGLSLDGAPDGNLRDCALFGFRVARLGTQYHWSHKKTVPEQIEFARQALDDYNNAGIKVVLQVTPNPEAINPEDLAYNQLMLPTLNKSFYPYNWNSKRRREFTNNQFQQFVRALGTHPAVLEFKMGNEPFWSTRLPHVTGFDQATVGCSAERWQQAVLDKYGSFDQWSVQFEPVIKQRQYSAKTADVISWRTIDQVGLAPENISGLTFIDFLQNKYENLEALNSSWYGTDTSRWLNDWSEIFPPIPTEVNVGEKPTEWGDEWADLPIDFGKKKLTSWRPNTHDIPAWMDWVEFFPYCINNALLDGRTAVKQANPNLSATCNCIGVHFLTDYLGLAPLGLRPWVMSDGLDSLAIDFYVIGYIQACMRSMTAIADGRPIHIHEAGGTAGNGPRGLDIDPKNTTFTTLYSFAYGADSLLFWRRDHHMEPVLMHAAGRAVEALENEDLQQNSVPLTDPVALVYSGTSLRYFYAKWGHSYLYTKTVQAGVAAANKLQWQYHLLEEKALESGIPNGLRVLVAPGAAAVSDSFFEAVSEFLSNGGTLITTDDFGTIDGHGRPRDKAVVQRIHGHSNIQVMKLADLHNWRDEVVVRNVDARFWSTMSEPGWLKAWEAAVEKEAPRTVTYQTTDGSRAGDRAAAVRKSDDALYVFVDPWARNICLKIHGQWTSAQDFYSRDELTVQPKENDTVVSGVNGPAVICLRAK